jgi:hypothetical protein
MAVKNIAASSIESSPAAKRRPLSISRERLPRTVFIPAGAGIQGYATSTSTADRLGPSDYRGCGTIRI